MGQTFNHVAAVIMPVVGGALWTTAGAQYTFYMGSLIALVCLGLTQFMREENLESSVVEEELDVLGAPTAGTPGQDD